MPAQSGSHMSQTFEDRTLIPYSIHYSNFFGPFSLSWLVLCCNLHIYRFVYIGLPVIVCLIPLMSPKDRKCTLSNWD